MGACGAGGGCTFVLHSGGSSSGGAIRSGLLRIERSADIASGPLETATPALLLYARRLLAVPNITASNLALLPQSLGVVHANVERCMHQMDLVRPESLHHKAHPLPATRFMTVLSAHDAAVDGWTFRHVRKGVTCQLRTEAGLHAVTPASYMRLARALQPDFVASLCEPPARHQKIPRGVKTEAEKEGPGGEGAATTALVTEKQALCAAQRSVRMTAACRAECEGGEGGGVQLLATLAGLTGAALDIEMEAAAALFHDNSNSKNRMVGIMAQTLPELSPAILLRAMQSLPRNMLRFSSSLATPDAMAEFAGCFDFFPSHMAFVLADANRAWNIDLYNHDGCAIIDLSDERFRGDSAILCDACACWTCSNHNKAYIFHLVDSHEMLSQVLLTLHNVQQLENFVKSLRDLADKPEAKETLEDFIAAFRARVNPMSYPGFVVEG